MKNLSNLLLVFALSTAVVVAADDPVREGPAAAGGGTPAMMPLGGSEEEASRSADELAEAFKPREVIYCTHNSLRFTFEKVVEIASGGEGVMFCQQLIGIFCPNGGGVRVHERISQRLAEAVKAEIQARAAQKRPTIAAAY